VIAARGSFGQVADCKAKEQAVMGGVAWLVQSTQLIVGVCVSSLSKRRQAAGVLHEGENACSADWQSHTFRLRRQLNDHPVLAA
jgi:hypothetical protein